MPASTDVSSASETDSNEESESEMMIIDEDPGNLQKAPNSSKLPKSTNLVRSEPINKKSPANHTKKSNIEGKFVLILIGENNFLLLFL